MSPGSSALRCFKCNSAIEICNIITFVLYTGLPHLCCSLHLDRCNSLSRYRATVIERISHCVSQKAGDTRFACFSDLAVWYFSDALQRMVQLVIEALDNA